MSTTFLPKGFSLIELTVVVAIIGILAMMAIPSYQHYTQRARFTEVINQADFFKTAVSLALQQGLVLTDLNNGASGIPEVPPSSKNLASVKVENGIITATGTELVNNATYILTPNDDGTVWSVSGTCVQNGLCHA